MGCKVSQGLDSETTNNAVCIGITRIYSALDLANIRNRRDLGDKGEMTGFCLRRPISHIEEGIELRMLEVRSEEEV